MNGISGQYWPTPPDQSANNIIPVQVDKYGRILLGGTGTPGTPAGVPQSVQGYSYASSVSFTRQNNTTPYDAGDVVGALVAALTFANVGPSGGGGVLITKAELELDITAVPSGMTTFNLQLYSVTPPSALADAATWDLPSGDRASYLGAISLGTPVDLGSTLYVKSTQINEQYVVPSGGSLFAYLVTVGAYTPTAQAVYTVKLKAIGI